MNRSVSKEYKFSGVPVIVGDNINKREISK